MALRLPTVIFVLSLAVLALLTAPAAPVAAQSCSRESTPRMPGSPISQGRLMRHFKSRVPSSQLLLHPEAVARAVLEVFGSFPVAGRRLDSMYNSKAEGMGVVDATRVMDVRPARGRHAVSWPRGGLFR